MAIRDMIGGAGSVLLLLVQILLCLVFALYDRLLGDPSVEPALEMGNPALGRP